jgi:hypothetical protein
MVHKTQRLKMWNQIINPRISGFRVKGGWCLDAVQNSFNTDHVYQSATAAWDGVGEKKTGLPPKGISVPVYFSLGSEPAGHVAVMFADGRVGSSTRSGEYQSLYMHPNLDDLIKVYQSAGWNIQYLGWKEYVGTRKVVEYKGNSVKREDAVKLKNVMRVLNSEAKGWDRASVHAGKSDEQEIKYLMSLNLSPIDAIVHYSQQAWNEGKKYREDKDKWKKAFDGQPALVKEIADLKKKVEQGGDGEAAKKLQAIKDALK